MTNNRKRTKANNPPSPPITPADLPPPRKSDPLKNASPPLSNTHLHRLIYLLVFLTALLSVYYGYRAVQWKASEWGIALGVRSPSRAALKTDENDREYTTTSRWWGRGSGRDGEEKVVEGQIDALARVLGVPRVELASAVAGVVREHATVAPVSETSK